MNKIIISLPLFLLMGCAENIVIETLPNYIEDNMFISSDTKQIIPVDNSTFIVSASVITKDITADEAKELAIIKACKIASDYYCEHSVNERLMTIYSPYYDGITVSNFTNLSEIIADGIIIKKDVLEETINILGETIIQTIKMKIRLENQPIQKSNININANLNKSVFQNDETIKICIESQTPVYLTILDIQPNNSVSVVYSNMGTTIFPSKVIKTFDKSISINPENLNGNDGIIKIFASSTPLNLAVKGDYKSSISKLLSKLIKFPQNQLVEINLFYEIQ